MSQPQPTVAVVIPTIGRPSLHHLLQALAADGPRAQCLIVVDDRVDPTPPLCLPSLSVPHRVLRSGGRGPAAARNVGWRAARTEWISFLDDDVLPPAGWWRALHHDLAAAADAAGTQARVTVPLPGWRWPTDWERSVAGLAQARWITADMAYRRDALRAVGGFDERFRRAYREDCDLAIRLQDRGFRLVRGSRTISHPVRSADPWVSVRLQVGNADDALMRRLHGPAWRERGDAGRGRLPSHLAVTGMFAAAAVLGIAGRRRIAGLLGALAAAETARFARERIRPGPRTVREVATMLATSVAIPPLATWHALRGRIQHRHAKPWRGLPEAVLIDRDGTLVEDVPYNGDPDAVRPRPTAHEAISALRQAGVPVAVVTNQSGVARGSLTPAQVEAVNARIDQLLGPFASWHVCPHGPDDGCECRKPNPGLLLRACELLDADPGRSVMIGDIGSDLSAAAAAGCTGVLVPTPVTLLEEVRAAERVYPDLAAAAGVLLSGTW